MILTTLKTKNMDYKRSLDVKHKEMQSLMTKFFVLAIACGLITFWLIIMVVLRLQLDLPFGLHVLLFVSASFDQLFTLFAVWVQFGVIGNKVYLKIFACCHNKVYEKWNDIVLHMETVGGASENENEA